MDQGGEEVRANGEIQLPHGFRAVADIDYLSSFIFRLAFSESFTLAVNSEVRSNAFLSKAYDGYFFNLDFSRYQNFESTQRGDLVTILHAPALDLSSVDHQLGRRRRWRTILFSTCRRAIRRCLATAGSG